MATTKTERESQNASIMRYLTEHGKITQAVAYERFRCFRLASRINELRKRGYDIETRYEQSINANGRAVRYAIYTYEAEVGA